MFGNVEKYRELIYYHTSIDLVFDMAVFVKYVLKSIALVHPIIDR